MHNLKMAIAVMNISCPLDKYSAPMIDKQQVVILAAPDSYW
jgi:hypothetical protein